MTVRPAREDVLPIEEALPELRRTLTESFVAVLQAPPGAGKTTRVPLALLADSWLTGQRLIMLEPRRLAARAAARRMASTLGEPVGETVGFRVRGETRVGRRTRIEVVTEGVLTRLLQTDPTLDGVALVIFDEFHERSVHADLGLALCLQTREVLRPELRLLVMSATLDGAGVAALLGGAPIVTSEGRSYPVEVRYAAPRRDQRVEGAVASAIRRALVGHEGSILAFLPGAAEIRRTLELLPAEALPSGVRLHPLYGDLPSGAQDAAIRPPAPGERKIVLATAIAESSLTIEGIRVVIDGGLARRPEFSPRSGMTRLETSRVSLASAEQRRGRAGRTAPGVCYRLWAIEEQAGLRERTQPEILDADLTALSLELARAGIGDPASLRWLDPPPSAALAHARELLLGLDAVDGSGLITPHGREMADLGVHPRLAHMLLLARGLERGATACVLAALLDERDIMRRDADHHDSDLRARLHLFAAHAGAERAQVDRGILQRVRDRSEAWRDRLEISRHERIDDAACGWLLALAYPDRVAQRRAGAGDRYLLVNGRGVRVDDPGSLAGASFLVVADLDGRAPESRVYLAAPLDPADIEHLFGRRVVHEEIVEWDPSSGAIAARGRVRLGAIVLRDAPLREPDDAVVASALLRAIERHDGVELAWTVEASRLRDRVAFLRALDSAWPDWSDSMLGATLGRWLLPHLGGLRRRSDVEQLDLAAILLQELDWEQRVALDRLAPTHVVVPGGSRLAIDYSAAETPVLAVRLQEMFGLADTPRVADGRVPLTLQLLSPAGRPVQVTRDLAGFWRSSYFEVRKELRGRYPRHEWPEDPLGAQPTRRARPRRR